MHQLPIRLPSENTRRVARISQRKPRQLATVALNALVDNGSMAKKGDLTRPCPARPECI